MPTFEFTEDAFQEYFGYFINMHDIKKIRELPSEFDEKLSRRGIPGASKSILKLDKEKRKRIQILESLKASLNNLAKEFGEKKAIGESLNLENYKSEIQAKKESIQILEEEITVLVKLSLK